jgi:hypothetical protein
MDDPEERQAAADAERLKLIFQQIATQYDLEEETTNGR